MDRFWDKVDIQTPDECWEWLAYRDPFGYGIFNVRRQRLRAHRVAWELIYGDIPKDETGKSLLVCHRCDNPSCCNPTHLFVGTSRDNSAGIKERSRGSARRGGKGYYRGYSKWFVQFSVEGKRVSFGSFDTEEEAKTVAENVYKKLEKQYRK